MGNLLRVIQHNSRVLHIFSSAVSPKMKVKKFREKELPTELVVRTFSTKWTDESTEAIFRIQWKDGISVDISLNKRQVRSLIEFLEDWLEHEA